MTTLPEYLATGAVEDVRKLLECSQVDGKRLLFPDGPLMLCDYACDAWRAVVIASLGKANVSYCCYYREAAHGQFIVSDCGETVSEVMRRTGLSYIASAEWAGKITSAIDMTITKPASVANLPAAIVAVLSAVAKVRAEIEKERS